MIRIGEYRDHILYQSPKDSHIEAWRTKSPEIIKDGDKIRKFSDHDVERIITTATTIEEAYIQIDRKLKKTRVSRKERMAGQVNMLDVIKEQEHGS